MSRHHHHEPPPPACCSCCCSCGCGAPSGYYPAPPPPPSSASDHLLHAIAAHLLLNSAPPPPPQPQHQPQPQPPPPQPQYQPPPPPPPAAHQANLYAYAYQYQHQQTKPHAYAHAVPQPPPPQQQQPNLPDHGQLLLHSLLRRVATLESTLPHCFPSPPATPHQPKPRPRRRAAVHQEEEEERSPSPPPRHARAGPMERAARTIQVHFRRFLARRSRTLRQLKELAVLRSKAAELRGALSGSSRRRCGDPAVVSEAAMRLLFHLDAIQGEDPMIREGKRAVSRELSRILEFVDKVLVKEQDEPALGGALDTDEYHDGCNGAFAVNPSTVSKKKVSFYGNAAENDADESSESSSSAETDEKGGINSQTNANGKPGLAAPSPVLMESRRVPGERR